MIFVLQSCLWFCDGLISLSSVAISLIMIFFCLFPAQIMQEIKENDVQIYTFPTDDQTVSELNKKMNVSRTKVEFRYFLSSSCGKGRACQVLWWTTSGHHWGTKDAAQAHPIWFVLRDVQIYQVVFNPSNNLLFYFLFFFFSHIVAVIFFLSPGICNFVHCSGKPGFVILLLFFFFLQDLLPFAVVGSREEVEVNGQKIRARLYPWGTVESEKKQITLVLSNRPQLQVIKAYLSPAHPSLFISLLFERRCAQLDYTCNGNTQLKRKSQVATS